MPPVEGLLVSVVTAAAAGDISGMEIEAGPKGFWCHSITVDAGAEGIAVTIDAVSQFDQAVSDVTPLCQSGPSGASIGATVRTGQDSAGTIIGSGAYIPNTSNNNIIPFFVSSGKFLTLRQRNVTTATIISVQFTETDG